MTAAIDVVGVKAYAVHVLGHAAAAVCMHSGSGMPRPAHMDQCRIHQPVIVRGQHIPGEQ